MPICLALGSRACCHVSLSVSFPNFHLSCIFCEERRSHREILAFRWLVAASLARPAATVATAARASTAR